MNPEFILRIGRVRWALWFAGAMVVASCSQFNLDVPDAVSSASVRSDASTGTIDAPAGTPGTGGGGGTSISGTGGTAPSGGAGGGSGGAGGSGPADPTCQPAFHLCHGTCVDSKSPMTCGMFCDDPCPVPMDGVATCDGNQCGAACPGGKKLCLSACISDTQACTGMCPSGSHNCNGICADDKSPNFCGGMCKACHAPQGGTAACTNGECVYACDRGKLCGDKCGECCKNEDCAASQQGQVATCDLSTNHCMYPCQNGTKNCHDKCVPTASCCEDKDCPMNAGKAGKCDSSTGQCNYSCAGDTKPCGSGCIPGAAQCCEDRDCKPQAGMVGKCDAVTRQCNFSCSGGTSSPDSCGPSCMKCSAPQGGKAACLNGQCDFTCPAGSKCGNACRDVESDNQNCGSCGHVCNIPNAQSTCKAGQCQITTCKAGFADCDGNAANGCEITTGKDDPNHCGGCRACTSGQMCQGGNCVGICGMQEGGACCASKPSCVGNLVCKSSVCVGCGATDEPCCETNRCSGRRVCFGSGGATPLDGVPQQAPDGICYNCGSEFAFCCPSSKGSKCGSGLTCLVGSAGNQDFCFNCQGGSATEGQPCCRRPGGTDFDACASGFVCQAGTCTKM
jgi:hypothetical protein